MTSVLDIIESTLDTLRCQGTLTFIFAWEGRAEALDAASAFPPAHLFALQMSRVKALQSTGLRHWLFRRRSVVGQDKKGRGICIWP